MEDNIKLIKQYCGDVEQRLRSCRSQTIAAQLVDRLCTEVEMNCKSQMVQSVLKLHVDKLIGQIFDSNGNNIYLEDTDAKTTHSY